MTSALRASERRSHPCIVP